MILIELFNNPVQYSGPIQHNNKQVYDFVIEELEYKVIFSKINTKYVSYDFEESFGYPINTIYEIAFGIYEPKYKNFKLSLSSTGNEIKVFSTVLSIINNHLRKTNYKIITLSADIDSRIKLYDKLIKKIDEYELYDVFNDEEGKNYILIKK